MRRTGDRAGRGGGGHHRLPAATPHVPLALRRRFVADGAGHRMRLLARIRLGQTPGPTRIPRSGRLHQSGRRRSRPVAGGSIRQTDDPSAGSDFAAVAQSSAEDHPRAAANLRER